MTVEGIRAAAERVAYAEEKVTEAKAELREAVIEAIDEGMSPQVVAEAARVSRQTIWNWTAP